MSNGVSIDIEVEDEVATNGVSEGCLALEWCEWSSIIWPDDEKAMKKNGKGQTK